MKLSKDSIEAWRANPVTEEFFAALNAKCAELISDWNDRAWGDERMWERGDARYERAQFLGAVQALQFAAELTFEEEIEEDDEDQTD